MKKIVAIRSNVFCDIPEFLSLKEKGYSFTFLNPGVSEDEILANMKDAEGCVISGAGYLTRKIFDNSPNLKFVSFLGIGYASYMDAEAATNNGVAIMNAPGANANAVAELTIGLVIDLLRSTTYLNNLSKEYKLENRVGHELSALSVGIVGMGNIARRLTEILVKGFGTKVTYTNRTRREQVENLFDIEYLPLEDLLKNSDVVLMAVPDTPDTRGMIGEKEIALMKDGAILVNTARARLVDGKALVSAVESGKIGGFATDIHYIDPLPKNASEDEFGLMKLPNNKFVLTPHIGAATREAVENTYRITGDNLASFVATGDCKNLVNPDFRKNLK